MITAYKHSTVKILWPLPADFVAQDATFMAIAVVVGKRYKVPCLFKKNAAELIVKDGIPGVYDFCIEKYNSAGVLVKRLQVKNYLCVTEQTEESDNPDGRTIVAQIPSEGIEIPILVTTEMLSPEVIEDIGQKIYRDEANNLINAEKERAEEIEAALGQRIDTERQRAERAEGELKGGIMGETGRAQAAEKALGQRIDTEKQRAETKEGALESSLNAAHEATNNLGNTKADITYVDGKVMDERLRAVNAEGGLSSNINAERHRATNAEGALSEQISRFYGNLNTADEELSSMIDGLKIQKLDSSSLPSTWLDAWELIDKKGNPHGVVINTYKDRSIGKIEKVGQSLQFTYNLADGRQQVVTVDLGDYINEAEFDHKGFIVKNGVVYLNIAKDADTQNYLHFNSKGELSLYGIENFMKDIEDDRQEIFEINEEARKAEFRSKESQRDLAVEEATKVSKKVDRNTAVLGPYADRAPIVLTLEENGKAINRAGVKVNKAGWAICSFVGQKGDVYSFDPGVMDNDVCIFSEEIVKKEYRPIEYKYTYDAEGLPTKAAATYNGAVHSYTFTYEKDSEGHVTSETITDDQTREVLNALPYQYQSVIGTYHPLTILNASAELPLDHHCRLISHFQGEGTIRVTVSFNVASADMNLLVFRDGLIANLATQLGTIFQMISETNKALALVETQVKSLDSAVTNIVHTAVDDSALPTLCGQPPILFGAGTPQEAIVPDNWKQFDPETGEGYNWNGEPSAIGQQYINTSASTGGRYIAVPSADGGLTWKNF